jgi:hypothetical protein
MLDDLQRYVARARLVASPIRLGDWLTEHFGNELVTVRRARERAAKAIEAGPVASVTPIAPAAGPLPRPVSLWPPAAPPAEVPAASSDTLAPKKARVPIAAFITVAAIVIGLVYYFTR